MTFKKNTKTIVIIVVLVALCLSYYFYLSNRNVTAAKIEQQAQENAESLASTLVVKNIMSNYPSSPKEVLSLYARLTKAFYNTDTTPEQIAPLGKQARLLYDDELKSKQTEEEYITALQKDVEEFKALNRYVSDFTVDGSSGIEYKVIDGRECAVGTVVYYIREGSKLQISYHSYKLRKDAAGKWKILYWELTTAKQTN